MRTAIKTIGLCIVACLAVVALAPQAQAQMGPKIGIFNPQRVSEETDEGKRVQANLATIRDTKTAELKTLQDKIEGLQAQLTEQALSLSADRRSAMEMEINRFALDLESAREKASRELQLEVASAQQRFNERLIKAVETVGKSQGFDMILDNSIVAFYSSKVDVTTAIIDEFNKLSAAP